MAAGSAPVPASTAASTPPTLQASARACTTWPAAGEKKSPSSNLGQSLAIVYPFFFFFICGLFSPLFRAARGLQRPFPGAFPFCAPCASSLFRARRGLPCSSWSSSVFCRGPRVPFVSARSPAPRSCPPLLVLARCLAWRSPFPKVFLIWGFLDLGIP